MHRGLNSDYQRAPVPPSQYVAAAGSGVGRSFPAPYYRPRFPSHFQNLVSYPISIPPPGFQRFSNEPSYQEEAPPAQFPVGRSLHQDELQNLEVTKKAEEFLRMLETKDWIKPPGKSADKGTKRPGADGQPERHASKKHTRGRSWSRSRSRSRGRSQSRGQSLAKSRAHSRGKSQARSRSRSRRKSCSRTKSRPCSRSRERSLTRSKSQPRLCKDSLPSVIDTKVPSVRVLDLIQNLKQIIQSKELEKHLSVKKETSMINQQENAAPRHVPEISDPENSVLPHERVSVNDSTSWLVSWNNRERNPEAFTNKCVFSSVEDEEEFLYGEDNARKKPQAVTVPLAQTPTPITTSRQPMTPDVSAEECEKVKNLLKTIGLNLNQADIKKMAARLKQKQAEQREASTSTPLRTTLETLMNCSEVQKSDDCRSNCSKSSQSHRESNHTESEKREREGESREKQIQKKRKEYLVKELEGLLKHEGSGDLIPVIGFFCQSCEEFFGDLKSAEEHKHTNTHQDRQLKDFKLLGEKKPTEGREQRERTPKGKRLREDTRSTEDKSKEKKVKDDTHSHKSSKKKKKKEKKKEKKKKKKIEKKVKQKS